MWSPMDKKLVFYTMAGCASASSEASALFSVLIPGNRNPLGASFALSFLAAENAKDQEAKNASSPGLPCVSQQDNVLRSV